MENKYDEPSLLWQGGSFSWQMMDMLYEHNIITDLSYINYGNYYIQYPIKSNTVTLNGFSNESLGPALSGKDIFVFECNEQNIYKYCPSLRGIINANDDYVGFMYQYLSTQKLSDEKNYPASVESDTEIKNNTTVLLRSNAIKQNGLTIDMSVPVRPADASLEADSICVYVNDVLTRKIPCTEDSMVKLDIPSNSLPATENDIYKIRVQLPDSLQPDKTSLNYDIMSLKIMFHYIGETK